MAIVYQATLTPSKLDVLRAWVAAQPWSGGADPTALELAGAYRFDDPDGEVGIETHLLRAGPIVLQVPTTYRAAPYEGADAALIGTAEHSVLGPRWFYDGCADPVYAQALATAVLTGGVEATLDYRTTDGRDERRSNGTRVQGSGDEGAPVPAVLELNWQDEDAATVIRAGGLELVVHRQVGRIMAGGPGPAMPSLIGTWPGQDYPVTLVTLR